MLTCSFEFNSSRRVFISTPLFYLAYKLGAWLLGRPALPFHFELSWAWLVDEVGVIGAPFLFGCLVLGIFHAAAGYLAVRGLWRLHLVRSWQARKRRRNSHRG